MSPLALLLAVAATAEPSPHALSAYAQAGAQLYLSDARTVGGLGGGLGVRDTLAGRFVAQADAAYLTNLGNAFTLRVAGGVQRRGTWAPAALLAVTGFFGQQLRFYTPDHPTPIAAPAVALGLVLAPLRFDVGSAQLSALELGVGLGTDLPGLAKAVDVQWLQVGVALP